MFSASFFRLRRGGLDCSHDGLRLAGETLLKKGKSAGGRPIWEPVTLPEFESALLSAYGVAEGAAQRIGGLRAVAAALNAGDIVLAQIAAVHLRLPDPLDLERGLGASGLTRDWDPAQHPRQGGPPNAGWFAPRDGERQGDSGAERQPAREPNVVPDRSHATNENGGGKQQQLALAEPHDLVAIQNLPYGVTICLYQGRFLGGIAQFPAENGICRPTIWLQGGASE